MCEPVVDGVNRVMVPIDAILVLVFEADCKRVRRWPPMITGPCEDLTSQDLGSIERIIASSGPIHLNLSMTILDFIEDGLPNLDVPEMPASTLVVLAAPWDIGRQDHRAISQVCD